MAFSRVTVLYQGAPGWASWGWTTPNASQEELSNQASPQHGVPEQGSLPPPGRAPLAPPQPIRTHHEEAGQGPAQAAQLHPRALRRSLA